jgi:hypothetical protein
MSLVLPITQRSARQTLRTSNEGLMPIRRLTRTISHLSGKSSLPSLAPSTYERAPTESPDLVNGRSNQGTLGDVTSVGRFIFR